MYGYRQLLLWGLFVVAAMAQRQAEAAAPAPKVYAYCVELGVPNLKPRGVAVMIEAEHMCMSLRGVQKSGSMTVTTHFSGIFREDANQQIRFMTMLRGLR